ncbi:MAG: alpha/beta fold hydrolase [Oscillospiraceae bacterium]
MKTILKSKMLWSSLAVILVIILIMPIFLTSFLYGKVFSVRVNSTDNYFDYISTVRPDFKRTSASFNSNNGQKLQGYFYLYDNSSYKGLIVIAHGMGGGHEKYIAEAEYFAKNGYLVFAYDNTGTNESEGDKLIGLSQSAIDLDYALKFIESIPEVKPLPLLLYGHSWGGFAVCAVNNYPHQIKGIVSVAGFEKSGNVFKQQGKLMVGNAINILMPYVSLHEHMLFGKSASNTGISGLSKTDAKVFIIQSEDDEIVDYQDNFMAYKDEFYENPRFSFLSLKTNGHNAVLSPTAAAEINEIHKKKNLISNHESPQYKELDDRENALILDFDEEVMKKIISFYDELV